MKSSLRFTLNMRDPEFQSVYASGIVFLRGRVCLSLKKRQAQNEKKTKIKLKLYPVCLKTNDFSILSLYPVRVSCRADSTYISIVCYTICFF